MRSSTLYIAAAAAGVCVAVYLYRQRLLRLPTAEEQAWLEEQMRTPKPAETPSGQVSAEEQKWMEKQIDDAETADVHNPSALERGALCTRARPPLTIAVPLLTLHRCLMTRGRQPLLLARVRRCANYALTTP